MWPAFWMLGDSIGQIGWPACGEIDIMEWIGKDSSHIYGSTHANGRDNTNGYTGSGFHDGFHTYAANWQPDRIEFYVDGNNYATVWQKDQGGSWPFAANFFMILNLAVGGNWPGNPDGSTQFPQELVVDYVRVYEIDWSIEADQEVAAQEAATFTQY
jgi:beta-glucanase (GH16 family)